MNMALNIERRNDIDWLRVLAVIVVFLFHCAVFFSYEDWPAKNNTLDFGMTVFVSIVGQWIMPLFFILSAASAYYSLERRTSREYIGERFLRLIVPLTFGIFVLSPPQVYIERLTHGEFTGSFVAFFPHYFDGFYRLGGNFAWMGLHLWYLEMLFVFTIITLPLFLFLRKEPMKTFVAMMAGSFKRRGTIFLFAIPVGVVEMLVNLQPNIIGRRDFGGWSPLVYLTIFVNGYVIALDTRFRQSIEKQRITALLIGIITTVTGYVILTSGGSSSTPSFSFLRAFNSWFWLMAIIGFGSRYLTFSNRFLRYANEAVLPFYILHQTIIVIVGYSIADWDMSVRAKYIFLVVFSFILISILYHKMIRCNNVSRFIFGMKLKGGESISTHA